MYLVLKVAGMWVNKINNVDFDEQIWQESFLLECGGQRKEATFQVHSEGRGEDWGGPGLWKMV